MNLVRFNPVRDLDSLQNQVNRLFSTFSADLDMNGTRPNSWFPPVDIWETADAVIVKAEVPGVNSKNLDIRLENNVLTIRGERQLDRENTNGDYYHRIERHYGVFTRSFTIPGYVDDGHIKADYKDGVLKVTLPKKESAKPRRIELVS